VQSVESGKARGTNVSVCNCGRLGKWYISAAEVTSAMYNVQCTKDLKVKEVRVMYINL
jgi:hypothetical protein